MVDINQVTIRDEADEVVASAHIAMPGHEGEAWYRLPAGSSTDSEAAADAFFIIGLILAMGSDGELVMDEPVSKRLIYNSRAAQDILLTWYPKRLRSAQVKVPVRNTDKTPILERTTACFTGGVDSFHTLIQNHDDVGSLLYVHGFDIPLFRSELREVTSAHLQDVASMTGKELIEVSTNIRQFLNLAASWPAITHGPALSAVAHLLSAQKGQLLLPASHTYADSYAWGSHPLLDHLWSSNRLSVIHDGAGATRVEKTRILAYDPAARRHLRVCWQNTGKYNCGKCDKCVRTMVALSIAGVLSDFETFDSEVPLDAVRNLKISGMSSHSFVRENLEYAERNGATEIAAALHQSIEEYKSRKGRGSRQPSSLASLERRLVKLENETYSLQRTWPIRTWTRFARWRHRTASK